MDPRLIDYYHRELQHIRETGGEFAAEYPKIAARLGLEGFDCADPYVERLLEGFAFLAARVQLKIDAEFPRFSQHLLEMVYPDFLAPMPSMAVVQLQPDPDEGALADGFVVERGSTLRSLAGRSETTNCEYRTAHDVTLWPVELAEVEYLAGAGAFLSEQVRDASRVKAAIRLRLRTTAGLTFDQLALDTLPVYLRGNDELPMHLYEQMLANAVAIVVQSTARPVPWREVIDKTHIRRTGFEPDQALLPYGSRSFEGYRLLSEYFAFPDRYMFVELGGLGAAARRCTENEIDVVILLDRFDPFIETTLEMSNFALFCTPAVNLFPKRADRIHLTDQRAEHHVIPDRTRPIDFEVYAITGVTGIGSGADTEQEFRAFYAADDVNRNGEQMAYYTVRRSPRVPSPRQRQRGARSNYGGSEVFVSLVDAREAPYRSDLRQIAVATLCTNRDLPVGIATGKGRTDFTMESGAPVAAVRCVAGPTDPRPSQAESETTWQLISHLSLNYLSLMDDAEGKGAVALRELLMLYGNASEAHVRKQIDGVDSVSSKPVTRRISSGGPITFGRGIEIEVTLDETAFEGAGIFLLGAVLEQFFAKYVSINSFTETVVRSVGRGEVMRWPVRTGRRHVI